MLKKIGTTAGCVIVAIAVFFAVFLLVLSKMTNSIFIQIPLDLFSLFLIFYFSHPLGHFVFGGLAGVDTTYFFIASSGFKKLGGVVGKIGQRLPTIGTKFGVARLATVGKRKRAIALGSGVLTSNTVLGIAVLYVALADFYLLTKVLSVLLFLGTASSEVILSSKAGDIAKLKRALA